MKIVVIDNYDSFTYNLVHAIKKISGLPVDVFRNDEIALEDLEQYDKIVLSPGPGVPEEAGLLLDIIRNSDQPRVCWEFVWGIRLLAKLLADRLPI